MSWLWKKLGAVPPEEMAGLQLHFDGCWAITAPCWDPEVGFAALPKLTGKDATLYLEGGSHSDEVATFIDAHLIPAVEQIARGTIWPRQAIYHLPATSDVFDGLSRLADHHALFVMGPCTLSVKASNSTALLVEMDAVSIMMIRADRNAPGLAFTPGWAAVTTVCRPATSSESLGEPTARPPSWFARARRRKSRHLQSRRLGWNTG